MADQPLQESACKKCGGKGKISYRMLGQDVEPRPFGDDGTTIQDMGGWGTRACECVRDLPATDGHATWWETESIYSTVVDVPIGCECIEVEADCEVPRGADGRRYHRTAENAYYPPMVNLTFPGPSAMLLSDTAREFAKALIAAADACDKANEMAGPVYG